jgi:hypothetical protein
MCSKTEGLRQILRYEGNNIRKDEILYKRLRNVDAEMGTRRIVEWKNGEQWEKIEVYSFT